MVLWRILVSVTSPVLLRTVKRSKTSPHSTYLKEEFPANLLTFEVILSPLRVSVQIFWMQGSDMTFWVLQACFTLCRTTYYESSHLLYTLCWTTYYDSSHITLGTGSRRSCGSSSVNTLPAFSEFLLYSHQWTKSSEWPRSSLNGPLRKVYV